MNDAQNTGMSARAEDVGLSTERLARIDGWMDQWVDSGRLPCAQVRVMRHGQIVYARECGHADIARGARVAADTMFRIYSMTKPLTSTAIMMLYEEGRFQLDDPISRFLPHFANMRVYTGGSRGKFDSVPAVRDITFRDLLTHTSGLTYGFMQAHPVDGMYLDTGVDFQSADATLGQVVERLAKLPLIAQPGEAWNYSVATDVLGHLVEVISGQNFGDFLRERVIGPLGMTDTDFYVPTEKLGRFAANYALGGDGALMQVDDPLDSRYGTKRELCSGGGGLVSTSADYLRFCRMMLGQGAFEGTRLLGRKTVELMTANHLRGDMAAMGQARFSESSYEGVGFGLGFSVTLDPARAQLLGSAGEYAWGGAASTAFWIDPVEDMAVVLMTQLSPSSTYPIRRELRVLTYQALV